MKYFSIFILAVLSFSCGENGERKNSKSKILFYSEHIAEGRRLAKEHNYKAAAAKYTDAFIENPGNDQSSDRVDAAYYWLLADEIDSAFFQLNTFLRDTDYVVIKITDLTKDKRLAPLRKYPEWNALLEGIKRNRKRKFPNINAALADKLDEIKYADQYYRLRIEDMQQKYGPGSEEWKSFLQKWQRQDSINLKKVLVIMDEYGWLGDEEVGYDGNTTLFLVIQHADSATQRKYLPLMRIAVKEGKASGSDLALLEDRVALGMGKKQIYGSQVSIDPVTRQAIVLPLEDPDNVDKRRAAVGLPALSGYLMHWDIEWDAKKYKLALPYYELKMKMIEKIADSLQH